MRAVKSSGSIIERQLGTELWSRGLRYRKNNSKVYGKPDFTFASLKIAIFVDSEFWHGKDWDERKHDHKSNVEFWHNKIERNIARDKEVNEELLKNDWTILRFWGKEIKQDLITCVDQIERAIEDAKGRKKLN